jgi:hypothetical protein
MLSGISFAACLRTTSGTRSFPIPWPVKSRTIVTRDPESPERASTDTFTIARIGPSIPRSAQRRGGSYSVISVVTSRSRPPMFRTVVHREPTVVVGVSRRPRTTPFCHSDMVLGSITYAKTSSGGLATSVLETMGANWTPSRLSAVYCPPLHGRLGLASRIRPCPVPPERRSLRHRTYPSTRRHPRVVVHFAPARLLAGVGHQDPTEQVQVKDKGKNEYQAPPSSRITEHDDDYDDPNSQQRPDHQR